MKGDVAVIDLTARSQAGQRGPWWRDFVVALLLAAVSFVVFNANMRAISAADAYAPRYLPFSILRNHTVVLDPILETIEQGRLAPTVRGKNGSAFWITHGLERHQVSTYPVFLPVVIAPLYLPAAAYLDERGWDPHLVDQVARFMEKLIASLIAAASVALLYFLLRRRCAPPLAAALSLVYAFGTTTWAISSQALWPHGMAQLLAVATMLLLTGPRTAIRVALAGLLCASIAANRPPDALLALGLGGYGLWWAGRLRSLFIAAGLIPVGLTVAYNLGTVGHIAGAYALFVRPHNYNDNVLTGILGLLFSPTRGLFVFSPFLLFLLCLFPLALRDQKTRGLTLAISAAIALQVILYASVDWRQGVSFGPRWLGDMLPLVMWMLPPVIAALSTPGRVLFAAACVISIAIQAVGAFWYLGTVDATLVQGNGPDRMRGMWQPQNAPFIAELKHPPAPADLLRSVRGNIDLIQVVDVVVDEGDQGERLERQVDVAGWSLVDSRTPVDVALFVDGRLITGTGAFFVRPDVAQTLQESSPAGWRVGFPVGDLAPGTHSVAALVRTDPGAEPRLLRVRAFEVPAPHPNDGPDPLLERAAQLAAQQIVDRQQAPGYWLTTFTGGTSYEKPQPEMNTYLNAVMLDVLGPAAAEPPLRDAMARVRAFLTRQIEPDGLVRYHGLPDAPTIGILGCAITPDSDDTTLVWRVAPAADRSTLAGALKNIEQFRRPDGLYRTWLAERAQFKCLDPGSDPNPADLVIQMHILMLLAQEDPPAAASLCRALSSRAADDSLWVYYSGAPAMAILRLADLARAGCPLQLRPQRMRVDDPGQQLWVEAAHWLTQLQSGPPNADQRFAVTRLLRQLSAKNFARVASAPPLLYHNDLSATVRRFYWSQDLGYALWLRLYHELQHYHVPSCNSQSTTVPCSN